MSGWGVGGLFDGLLDPLSRTFMQHAFVAIVLVGVICGVTGAFVTLRGLAFMGDALAHAIFPGVVIAFVLGANFLVGALIAAVIVSLLIGAIGQSGRLTNDTAIGVLFAGCFALGVALISRQQTYTRDLSSFLFGTILGVSRSDLALTAAVGATVLLVMGLFRRELTMAAFDRVFAQASGRSLFAYDQLFLLLLSLSIVISIQTVGNILVLAMLVTPAATARLLTDRLGVMVALSALIGGVSGVVGLYVSYYQGIASGASVVLTATALFAVAYLFAPRTGVVTTAVARRLHHPFPERDRFPPAHDDGIDPRALPGAVAAPGAIGDDDPTAADSAAPRRRATPA
ncbi:MAG: Mn-Zn_transporter_SitD [uncultured Thermomicrobiales bacterium]|uniref:Mn-Zn_transporter_SitD n=1 Tax=uncultured Thermomicrobiales bacterium TaxID=1645740 RepID=A0A6J4UN41_9BACT|nr:MAG: Mn-Zn_transporter_SitD [uncultured Thermomicrobiales bacterium]